MRLVPLALVSLVVGASVWSCGGDDGSDPSGNGGQGEESGDGDSAPDTESGDGDTDGGDGDGDPGDGDGDPGDGDTDSGDGDEDPGDGDGDGDECAGDATRCTDDAHELQACVDGDWVTQHCNAEHGSCEAGTCACSEGWVGVDCETCVIYVKTDGDDNENGLSWGAALSSIQEALDLAAARLIDEDLDRCQVWAADGTYKPGTDVTSTFHMREGVDLYGGFAGNETRIEARDSSEHETILSGDLAGDDAPGDLDDATDPLHRQDNVYHVITGDNDALLDGLSIRGGGNSATEEEEHQRGSGLLHLNTAPTVRNCLFEDNYAWFDGTAIYAEGSDEVGIVSASLFVGNVSAAGSTVYFDASLAQLDQVVMRDNVNGNGALVGRGAKLSVTGSEFVGNEGKEGAALSASDATEMVVADARFDANVSAGHGGALLLDQSTAHIEGVWFSNNSAVDLSSQDVRGGAITATNSQTQVVNSVFTNNYAQSGDTSWGGAIENWRGSQMLILNSTFLGNAAAAGSAIRSDDEETTLEVINCSFYGNDSSATAGTLSNFESRVHVANSIFWGGATPEIDHVDAATTETTVVYSDVQGGHSGAGNLDVNPQFVDAASGDLHLASDSPVIDEGNVASLPQDAMDLDNDGDVTEPLPLDLDGNERIKGENVDMGAYEHP